MKFLKTRKRKILLIVLGVLVVFHLFFRFYELEKRSQFTWDQVDNAWHAKNLLVNHQFPLVGMPAKQDSGVSIGPAYYYFVTFFYWVTNLDPIASPIIAGISSVISASVLFLATRKIFNTKVAVISLFINTFSFYLISMDRIQWPVNFIAPVGLLIYLSLFQISKGKTKYIILLLFLLGLSTHIHFTSIFYFAIVLLYIPFFPRNKKSLKYLSYGFPLFLVWLTPFFVNVVNKSNSMNLISFYNQNSIGFHLRRVMQVTEVASYEAGQLWGVKSLEFIKYLILPVFVALYYIKNKAKSYPFLYLNLLWFVIPLFGLAMFKGELTPYYFALYRYVAIGLFSYVVYRIFLFKPNVAVPVTVTFAIIFAVINTSQFLNYKVEGLERVKKITYKNFKESRGNEFIYGAGESYLYYFYERKYYGWTK